MYNKLLNEVLNLIPYFAKEANDAFTSHFPQVDVNGHY